MIVLSHRKNKFKIKLVLHYTSAVIYRVMKKTKKTFNKLKHIKALARIETVGMNLGTRNHGDKKKYTRKIKHKKSLDLY